jgi:hypothetical protein
MRGLSGTLRRFGPPLIFEMLPNFSGAERTPISEAVAAERTERARKIFDFLTLTHGYEIFQIMANSEERPIPEFDLDTPAEFHGANYIARKGSQTNRPMYA